MKISHFVVALIVALLCAGSNWAQKGEVPTSAELAEITTRGRTLAAYDVAAWYSSDAVQAIHPREERIRRYIGKQTAKGWTVGFGRLNEAADKFLVAYVATEIHAPLDFKVESFDPPTPDSGFYFLAAKAIELSEQDFGKQDANRPYDVAVIPASLNQFYVYFYLAQPKAGVYVFGSDVRYLISPDGSSIVEKRQMHNSIFESKIIRETSDPNAAAGVHSHGLRELPEDADVFYVLSRKQVVPEMIVTENHLYEVHEDGTIETVF